MGQVTGGSVLYSRTVKITEYEPKKAEVRIDFTTADEAGGAYEAILQQACDIAVAKAHEILGLTTVAPKAGKGKNAAPVAETPPADPKPAAVVEEEIPLGNLTGGASAADASKQAYADAQAAKAAGKGGSIMADADPGNLDDLLGPAAKPITDEDLLGEITRKNAEIKNSAAIRALIAGHVPDASKPHQAYDIPADKRAAFVAALKDLKAAA